MAAYDKILDNHFKREWISRRNLLRGLGLGAIYFSPLMRSLAARAAGVADPKLLIMHTPNGFHTSKMTVNSVNGGPPQFADSLSSLNPYASQILVLKNLTSTLVSDGFPSSHEQQSVHLTGFNSVRGSSVNDQRAQGPSIDWIIAKALGQEPLGTGVFFDPGNTYKHLWKGKNMPNDPITNPRGMLGQLFPNGALPAAMPTPSGMTDAQKQKRCQLLRDALATDVKTLSKRLGKEDQGLLEPYLANIEGIGCATAPPKIDVPEQQCKSPIIASTADFDNSAKWDSAFTAFLDIIDASFLCGYRNVATISFGNGVSGINIANPGGFDHHHSSHTNENNLNPADTIIPIDIAYAKLYGRILEKFRSSGILDNVMVLWLSEMTDGNGHNQDNKQLLIGGGAGGRINTGRVIKFEGDDKDRCTIKLCRTLAHGLGVNIPTFGDTTKATDGPLAGVHKV